MKKGKKCVFSCFIGIMLGFILLLAHPAQIILADSSAQADSVRFGGLDRYETAVLIAQKGWTVSADNAVLAGGDDKNLVDVLTAAPLAKLKNGPILLTNSGANLLNSMTEAELKRLKVKNVYVVSGQSVIKPAVLEQIKGMGINIILLGGYDQFATALNIAKQMGSFDRVMVATGWQYADAASAAAIASSQRIPILLCEPHSLPDETARYLETVKDNIVETYAIGGTAVIDEKVFSALSRGVRLAGHDRYDTNSEVLKYFAGQINHDTLYVANGEDGYLTDALIGAPLASLSDSGLLLIGKSVGEREKAYIQTYLPAQLVALGGNFVFPPVTLDSLLTWRKAAGETLPPVEPEPSSSVPEINGGWQSTDDIKMVDNRVYQQYKLIDNEGKEVSLTDVTNIKVLAPGSLAWQRLDPDKSGALWFDIQNGQGKYIYAIETKDGKVLGACIDWEPQSFDYLLLEKQTYFFIYKVLDFTPDAGDQLIFFKPYERTVMTGFNEEKNIAIPREIARREVFIKHQGLWYKTYFELTYAETNKS